LDFSLPIFDYGDDYMNKKFWSQSFESSLSSNLKSKIEKRPRGLKSVGLLAIALTFALGGAVATAQQQGKTARIGLLDLTDARTGAVRLESFWQEIRKLGWIEGKNLVIEKRFAEEKHARLPELAADLVRLKVDVIVCASTNTALAAKGATTTIPVVFTTTSDPVGAGLVASLARPGGNVTGLSSLSVELNTKRLEVLKDAIPKLTQVGLLRTTGNLAIADELMVKEFRTAAVALKVKLEEIETQLDAQGLESAFQTAKQKQVGAIMTFSRPLFTERKRVVELAAKYRLPANYSQKEYVDEGGLMYYGIDYNENNRRAAQYVDKILKGAKPADLPVEQPTKFEFVINLKTAKAIGLTVPPDVLARATRIIR
jgi:putative tryptophan/tyrosine transport system substrate-binding protein